MPGAHLYNDKQPEEHHNAPDVRDELAPLHSQPKTASKCSSGTHTNKLLHHATRTHAGHKATFPSTRYLVMKA